MSMKYSLLRSTMVATAVVATVNIAAVLGLTGCSEPVKTIPVETEATKEPAAPPGPVTAKTAFWAIYKPARGWAADIQLLSLTAGEVAGIKNEEGKAGQWIIVVVSPHLQQARTYYYAVADQLPHITKGIKLGATVPWGGPTAQVLPIPISEFSTDSDAAYKAAFARASDWLKKHPNKQPALVLGNASRFAAPTWYVLWGSKNSGFEAFINATTGTAYK
jgi:hypothetical protein